VFRAEPYHPSVVNRPLCRKVGPLGKGGDGSDCGTDGRLKRDSLARSGAKLPG
jgi:hypothetical protein